MDRVAIPLRQMGVEIAGQGERDCPPLHEKGRISFNRFITICQSHRPKSSRLSFCCSYRLRGESTIIEKEKTRDHTEDMIRQFGGEIQVDEKTSASRVDKSSKVKKSSFLEIFLVQPFG